MTNSAHERMAVIIGSGAMGLAAARRFGPACRLLLADNSEVRLERRSAASPRMGTGWMR